MKIAVVGTSNSLRREGYFPFLAADPRVSEAVNLSIGASTSLHTIESTANCDFSQFDFALLEFAVNEEAILAGGGLDLAVVKGVVSNLIVRCLSDRCIPVIVIFPRLLRRGQKSAMQLFYRNLAECYSVPFLDIYEVVDFIRENSDISDFAIFKDSAHIEQWICCALSDIIIKGLQDLAGCPDRFVKMRVEAPGYASLPLVDIMPTWAERMVERSTSRSRARFAPAVSRDVLTLAGISAKAIVGVVVNLTETDCILRITAGETALIDLRNVYYKNPNFRLVVSSFPLPDRIEIPDGAIILQPLDSSAAEGSAVSSAKMELGRIRRLAVGALEISAVLVERPETVSSSIRPGKSLAGNILTGSHQESLHLMCRLYRSLRSVEQDALAEQQFKDRAAEKRARRKAAELMKH